MHQTVVTWQENKQILQRKENAHEKNLEDWKLEVLWFHQTDATLFLLQIVAWQEMKQMLQRRGNPNKNYDWKVKSFITLTDM